MTLTLLFTSMTVASATDGASFVSYSGVPTSMTPGETATVSVTMRNTGTHAWTNSATECTQTYYGLGSQSPENNTTWGLSRVNLGLNVSVAPNATHTFTFAITAPSTTGSYSFQWKMLETEVDEPEPADCFGPFV
ncbi:MAG: hypothetical protein J4F98_08700 [Acidobacteria bacterium]|nr:hypothetical protein [Acidobacteriota bacterium]